MTAVRVSHLSDARQTAEGINRALRRTDLLQLENLANAANDAAAATAGVSVGAYYRNGSILMIRVA